jgi:HD-GYP domain-containing protein (c-di-GMP phosphodiesterase class II)
MISDRPYRRAMSSERAIQELHRCAGAQFDPAVVDAFVIALARPTVDEPQDEVMSRIGV